MDAERQLRGIEASWLWHGDPDASPIAAGAVLFDGPRVVAAGPASELSDRAATWERHDGVLIPGLVNARVNLARGALAPGGRGWVAFARALAERGEEPEAVPGALDALVRAGTAAIAAVGTTLPPLDALSEAPLVARVYREVAGLRSESAELVCRLARMELAEAAPSANVALGLAPHGLLGLAPSFAAELVREALAPLPLSQGAGERAYLEEGTGEFAEWLREIGAEPDWAPPGLTPVDSAASIGALGPNVICTHLADARPHELRALAILGTRVVFCPRASAHAELLLPPLAEALAAGLRPGLGSDSLACAASLDVLDDAATLHERFSDVPPAVILAMATSWGARALDLDHRVGRFAPGLAPGAILFGGSGVTDPLRHVLARPPRTVLVPPGRAL
jgi:cytosine/adenosine deaminase-related metal-dependent hydrolase